MPGRVQHREAGAGHGDRLPVGQVPVRGPVRVGPIPELAVGRMQPDRRAGGLGQGGGGVNVVIMGVGAQDGGEPARPDGGQDRVGVVRGVDNHAFGVVAKHPDVVVHVPGSPVEGEGAGRDEMVHGEHQADPSGQRRSSRISTRGKPPATELVSAALVKPASSKSLRVPTKAIVRSTFLPWLSTG